MALNRTGCDGLTGGGCLKDLYTMYVLHLLVSKEMDGGTMTLSPPALTFLQPGLPERVVDWDGKVMK